MADTIHLIEIQIREFVELIRPPEKIRDQFDIGYNFQNNTVELFEIRPLWNDPEKKQQSPFAKIKYVKTRGVWKIYWKRASGKWEVYKPTDEVSKLKDCFKIIGEDQHGCFLG